MAAHLVRSQPNDDGDVFVVNTLNNMVEIKHTNSNRPRAIYEIVELTVNNKNPTHSPSAQLLTELIPLTKISSYTDEDPDVDIAHIYLKGTDDQKLTITFSADAYEPEHYDANLELTPNASALSLVRECRSAVAQAHKRLEKVD